MRCAHFSHNHSFSMRSFGVCSTASSGDQRAGAATLAGAIIYLAHQIFCSTLQLSDDVFSLPSPSGRGLSEGLTRKPFLTYDLTRDAFAQRAKASLVNIQV